MLVVVLVVVSWWLVGHAYEGMLAAAAAETLSVGCTQAARWLDGVQVQDPLPDLGVGVLQGGLVVVVVVVVVDLHLTVLHASWTH